MWFERIYLKPYLDRIMNKAYTYVYIVDFAIKYWRDLASANQITFNNSIYLSLSTWICTLTEPEAHFG